MLKGHGRTDQQWETFTDIGEKFLIERARQRRSTTYTEMNAALVGRTDQRGFDFERADERAAMGNLLGAIVEQNRPVSGYMISSLVIYLNASEPGSGFYKLAESFGLLPKSADTDAKDRFWIRQLNGIYDYYGPNRAKV